MYLGLSLSAYVFLWGERSKDSSIYRFYPIYYLICCCNTESRGESHDPRVTEVFICPKFRVRELQRTKIRRIDAYRTNERLSTFSHGVATLNFLLEFILLDETMLMIRSTDEKRLVSVCVHVVEGQRNRYTCTLSHLRFSRQF